VVAELLTQSLEEHLFSLEVRPAQLRSDPDGRTWLGDEWAMAVRRDPELMLVVRRFVEEELELYDSVRGQADAFFTARVLEATSPEEIAGAGLAPRYRSWVLASAYALAFGSASLIAFPWLRSQGYASWSGALHELVSHDRGEPSAGSWIFLLAIGVMIVGVLAFATRILARQRGPERG